MRKAIFLVLCSIFSVFAQQEPQEQQFPSPLLEPAYPPQEHLPAPQAQPQNEPQNEPQTQLQAQPQQNQQPPQPELPLPLPPPYQTQSQQTSQQAIAEDYKNFSSSQRLGTWALNSIVPGLGSYAIMHDWVGGVNQTILFSTGYLLTVTLYGSDNEYEDDSKTLLWSGFLMLGTNFVYNIVRSATYNKFNPNVQPADGIRFGIRYGINLTSFYKKSEEYSSDGGGFSAGFAMRMPIVNKIYFSPRVEFVIRELYSYGYYDSQRYEEMLISVPILIEYMPFKRPPIYFSSGIQFDSAITGDGEDFENRKKLDVGYFFGIGVMIGRNFAIDSKYAMMVTKPFSSGEYNSLLQISLGVTSFF